MTYAVMVDRDTTTGNAAETVAPTAAAANTPTVPHPPLPAFVPRDELYFWSYAWQESQRRSQAQLEAGEFVEFDDPRDMVRWLLSDD
jgi:hypothetical protein